MYSKMILEINNRTKVLFKAVLTGYQIDNVNTVTIKDSPHIISSLGDTACEIIGTCQIIFANVTSLTTKDRICSNNFLVGMYRW